MPTPRSLALLSPVALVFALGACGSTEVGNPAPPPVDMRVYQQASARDAGPQKSGFETERDSLEALGRALVASDPKTISAFIDPDANFSFPGMSDASDRDGMLKAMADLFGAFSDRQYRANRIWQIGQAAVVDWTVLGTHSAEWMGVKPTGKQVTIRGITLYFFGVNGLINDTHMYFGVGSVLAQLGAAPKGIETGPLAPPPGGLQLVVATGSDEEKKNVVIVNRSWDALEAKNEAGYLAPIADDIQILRNDHTTIEQGKEERRKYFKWVTRGLSSLSQTPLNAWGAGSFVIEEYTVAGVHSGKMTEIPPSGHAVRLHFVDVDEMKDGKIIRTWTFGNSLELLTETGEADRATPGNSIPVIR